MLQLKPTVLVVDDDPYIVALISRALGREGYEPIGATDGEAALRVLDRLHPNLVLLDVLMPGLNGYQVCRRITELTDVPVIMISIKGQADDAARGLEIGADDYIAKPFSVKELLARVRAVLRRREASERVALQVVQSGNLVVDLRECRATLSGRNLNLTPRQYRVLSILAINAGQILTSDQLLDMAWGGERGGTLHSLNALISRLRQQLGDSAASPTYIKTVAGIGYAFPRPQRRPLESQDSHVAHMHKK